MRLKIPSIPQDDDAKGIVVRILSYEYYLKPFWLTFKDPYIEVEYQISTRRMRLKESVYISILFVFLGIYTLIYPYTLYISDNPNKHRYKLISIITGCFLIITSILQIIFIYNKSINNLFNWPVLFIIRNSITFFVYYYLLMNDIFNIEYQSNLTDLGNKFIKFMYFLDTKISNTVSIFILLIFFLTILTIHVLNIQQFLITAFLHTLISAFFLLRYKTVYNLNFNDLYNFFGWRFASLIIPEYKNNVIKMIKNRDNQDLMINQTIYLKRLENQIKNYIYPYELSIFNINKYYDSLVITYIWLWIILIIFLFSIVYSREKGLRADFILRRVYSDIDKPRNLDSGIEIKELKNKNETAEDQEIMKYNLRKWKKDTDSNNTNDDKNINKLEVNIDLNEIESTIGDGIDLDEMGSIPDGKTVKSFISDSTFKNNKSEIISSVKKIIPKSYTKSEKSNNSVNDIESESHVEC